MILKMLGGLRLVACVMVLALALLSLEGAPALA